MDAPKQQSKSEHIWAQFSAEDFDAKQWVNNVLRTRKDKEPDTSVDAQASTLILKLQLLIQEVNNSLEEFSNQIIQNIPKVTREITTVKQEATLLSEQMQLVKEDITRVEANTAQSMQRLVELDKVKTRMQSSAKALQEVDNWSTLSSDVDEVFASQDITVIAAKLAGMKQSLKVLHDVADFEDRRRYLESLKDRLEALVAPKLIAAFNSHSSAEAKMYVSVFVEMERSPQLQSYYSQCHKNNIIKLWSAHCGHVSPTGLSQSLSTAYDELLSKWHAEYAWCRQVFTTPLQVLVGVFTEAMTSLDPPPARCLSTALDTSNEPINTLISMRQASLRFVKGLEGTVVDIQGMELELLYPLMLSIHRPYSHVMMQYPGLEQQQLISNLQQIKIPFQGLYDTVSCLQDSVPKVFTFGNEAVDHCVQLTGGWGLAGLQDVLESYFTSYFSKITNVLTELRKLCGLDGSVDKVSLDDVKDLPDSHEEWVEFQLAFQLIQCCGEMMIHCNRLKDHVISSINGCSTQLHTPLSSNTPFGSYDYLATNSPNERTKLMELLSQAENTIEEQFVLKTTDKLIHSLNDDAHKFAFDIIFVGLKTKLDQVPTMEAWECYTPPQSPSRAILEDLPQFSLSPLPYITEIGDYLLTLPQQLEPFMSHDNPALASALKTGKLPALDHVSPSAEEGDDDHPSSLWLAAIAKGTMDTYSANILKIRSITQHASRQLATDIAYLCNVLAALGQSASSTLSQMEVLFKAEEEEFYEYEEDESISKDLCKKLKKIRIWDDD